MKEQVNELPKSVRDELARQQQAETHPDADLLTAYSEGTATLAERSQIEQHLAVCGDCREVMFLAAPEKPAETPAIVTAKSRPRWFPVWAPWAAAAAILIVATVTYTRHDSPAESARMAKNEQPIAAPSPTTKLPATEEKADRLDEARPSAKEQSGARKSSTAGAPNNKDARESFRVQEADRTDELKKSVPQDSTVLRDDKTITANSADLALPSVAPAPPPGQPVYAARAARNAATKPGPAAPSQNQMQNQAAQNTASQNIAVGSASQTVEVTSEAAPVQDTKIRAGSLAGSAAYSARTKASSLWRISSSGAVERAEGPNWTPSLATPGSKFTVVAVIGPIVWAGGTGGTLFRSIDEGASWQPVTLPGIGDRTIAKIEFQDESHGGVATGDHHSWTTQDSGKTWQQR
jgi:hypothetical protein